VPPRRQCAPLARQRKRASARPASELAPPLPPCSSACGALAATRPRARRSSKRRTTRGCWGWTRCAGRGAFSWTALTASAQEAEADKEEGNALYAARRYADALAAYEAARRRDPGRAQYASNAAAALLALGRRGEALAAYCAAAALDPGFARPRSRLASLCSSAEGTQEVLEAAMALSAAQPGSAAARDLVELLAAALRARAEARHLFERGRYADAEALQTESLERLELRGGASAGLVACPGAALLLGGRSAARAAQNRFDEALADLNAALAIAPDDAELTRRREDMVRAVNRARAFGQQADSRGSVGAGASVL